jgi:hypothetical protein
MPNYAEEYVYWFLRLNGFFPLKNFVLHKNSQLEHTSDCDLLAVRPPFVYERIGGEPDDWYPLIREYSHPNVTLGVICEVKSGRYAQDELFKKDHIEYALGRLGLTVELEKSAATLRDRASIDLESNCRVLKLLVAQKCPKRQDMICLTLDEIYGFLKQRIEKYPKEKYRDRTFFHSDVFQTIIDVTSKNR